MLKWNENLFIPFFVCTFAPNIKQNNNNYDNNNSRRKGVLE